MSAPSSRPRARAKVAHPSTICCAPAAPVASSRRQGDCPPVLGEPLGGADAAALASRFRVLGDPGRLRLLGLIGAQPGGEACVCGLTSALGLSQPTVSHHLQVLHRAGFLARERRGVWVWYRVLPAAMASIRRALS